MTQWLSLDDAKILLQLLSTLVIPFAVSYLKKVTWTPLAKFGLAILLSVLAGALTSYVSGVEGSFIRISTEIFTASQGIYYVFFKSFGFEELIAPKTALADQIKQVAVATTVAPLTDNQAKAILNRDEDPEVLE